MSQIKAPSKRIRVLASVSILLILILLLGFRLMKRSRADTFDGTRKAAQGAPRIVRPARAAVPAPQPVGMEELKVPCWSCKEAKTWPVRFQTDLDLLAPLGTGSRNAALWFVRFKKLGGPRSQEAADAMERRRDHPSGLDNVLPPDDPLLLEAEPWCDMATMSFYKELLELRGFETEVPNLLLMLTLAKSWVARGNDAEEPDAALADYRRAIRLGRLLRQEDTTVIADLVGLVCIRYGAEGIYERAKVMGDPELALTVAVILGEVAPQKLMTAERVTGVEFNDYIEVDPEGDFKLKVPDHRLENIIERAKEDPDRRFQAEAMLVLNLVLYLGPDAQKEKVTGVLEVLRDSRDPMISKLAVWSLETPPSAELLEGMTRRPPLMK